MSSDLWYPGRIPLCTAQVITGLATYLDKLRQAYEQQSPDYIVEASRVYKDIYAALYAEGQSCLGSDADINALLTLLQHTEQAVQLCATHKQWDTLLDVFDALDTVRWSLVLKQEAGGTDDGEELRDDHNAATPPDAHGGAAGGADGAPESGEANGTDLEACE